MKYWIFPEFQSVMTSLAADSRSTIPPYHDKHHNHLKSTHLYQFASSLGNICQELDCCVEVLDLILDQKLTLIDSLQDFIDGTNRILNVSDLDDVLQNQSLLVSVSKDNSRAIKELDLAVKINLLEALSVAWNTGNIGNLSSLETRNFSSYIIGLLYLLMTLLLPTLG